jgi:prophage tail gpP-like protein
MAARFPEDQTNRYLGHLFFDLLRVQDLQKTAAKKIARGDFSGEELQELMQDAKELDLALGWKIRGFIAVYPEITGEEAVRRIMSILAFQETRNRRISRSALDLMRQRFNENIE